jgi:NTE family protein
MRIFNAWSPTLAVLLIGGLVCATGVAQEPAEPVVPAARPRVGLVLGGGGAKGAAHVGVLRVLDELKIPVDCVVGTSMGALVGATFAAGTPPADVEQEMRAIKWEQTVGGQGRRNRMPIGRKLTGITYTNSLEFGLGRGRLLAPGGLLNSQAIEQSLRTLVARAQLVTNFDELAIPFRAVATDMVGSDMVVLGSGDLAVAMRASMAIPGVFSPVVIDGKVLADGGLIRNLPVDVARDLCADVVIAVWISSPSPEAETLSSALTLLQRSLDVSIEANMRAQIASLTDADVGIEVTVGDMGSTDFQLVPDAIAAGRVGAEAQRDALLRYAVSDAEYAAWAQSVGRTSVDMYKLADVRINGAERVNPEFLRAQLQNAVPGATVTPAQVVADTDRIFQLGDFERVEYRFVGESDVRVLEIDVTEKSWGPNLLRGDFGIATYEAGDLFAIVRFDHDRTWINDRGGRWHNALQIGRDTLATSDFYQPLDVHQRFFVHPIGTAEQRLEDIYIDNDRVAQYRVSQLYGQVDVGANFGTVAQLRFGLRTGWSQAKLDTGLGLPELDRTTDTTIRLQALYDTRDTVALPTNGSFFNARYVRSKDWFGGDEDYTLIEGVYARSFTVRGGDSLSLIVGGADTLRGELPFSQDIELGGIRTFPGLRPGELRGDGYWFAGTSYYWRLVDMQPLFGNALYAGLRIQAGEVDQRLGEPDSGTLLGMAGSLTGRTPVGPFTLSVGWVDEAGWRVQFMLGRPVSEGSMLDELY